MKRFMIIGSVTIVLLIIILFYDPYKNYLAVYIDNMTIDQTVESDNYYWDVKLSNELISMKNDRVNSWEFYPNNNGTTSIVFSYINKETNKIDKTITYKFKIKSNKLLWLSAECSVLEDFPSPY